MVLRIAYSPMLVRYNKIWCCYEEDKFWYSIIIQFIIIYSIIIYTLNQIKNSVDRKGKT